MKNCARRVYSLKRIGTFSLKPDQIDLKCNFGTTSNGSCTHGHYTCTYCGQFQTWGLASLWFTSHDSSIYPVLHSESFVHVQIVHGQLGWRDHLWTSIGAMLKTKLQISRDQVKPLVHHIKEETNSSVTCHSLMPLDNNYSRSQIFCMKNQNILFTWFLDDIRCYVFLIISLHSPQQTPSGSIPFLQLDHSPWIAPSSWLCSQVSMERSSGVPVKRSVSTRGWRNRCHKMIHNGKHAENQLLTVFWGRTWKNTEICHSKSFGSSYPF